VRSSLPVGSRIAHVCAAIIALPLLFDVALQSKLFSLFLLYVPSTAVAAAAAQLPDIFGERASPIDARVAQRRIVPRSERLIVTLVLIGSVFLAICCFLAAWVGGPFADHPHAGRRYLENVVACSLVAAVIAVTFRSMRRGSLMLPRPWLRFLRWIILPALAVGLLTAQFKEVPSQTAFFVASLASLSILVVLVPLRPLAWGVILLFAWLRPSTGSVADASRSLRIRLGTALARIEASVGVLGIVAVVIAIAVAGNRAVDLSTNVYATRGTIDPGTPMKAFRGAHDEDVLRWLAPVIEMSGSDPDAPADAAAYFGASVTRSRVTGAVVEGSLRDPPPCADQEEPCYVLRPRCADGERCSVDAAAPGDPEGRDTVPRSVVAYGRVVWRPGTGSTVDQSTTRAAEHDAGDDVSWDASPWKDLIGVAQWWFFTPRDDWQRELLMGLGRATKFHEADWEMVSIGFSARAPVFVALSSHCGGTWRPWADVNVYGGPMPDPRDDELGTNLHVIAARTDGSHGFYFEAASSRGPDTLGCEGPTWLAGRLRGHLYLANIADQTSQSETLFVQTRPPAAAEPVLSYPAFWSLDASASARVGPLWLLRRASGSIADPAGPDAPRYKQTYLDPVQTVFCGEDWRVDNDVRRAPTADCSRVTRS
jgi:hypothetical protein